MKIDALFFVIILSLSYTTSVEVLSVDIMTPILKMDTQLSQLKVELKSPTNLTKEGFLEKIEEMLKNIEEDQSKHDNLNQKMSLQCSEEEKFRKMEISDSQQAYTASSETHTRCTQSLASAKTFLPELDKAVLNYKNQIKIKTEEREAQHKKYLELRKEWENAISFLNSFVNKIENSIKNEKQSSLLQLNEELIKHASKLGRMKDLVPIFIAMKQSVNISTQGNQNQNVVTSKSSLKSTSLSANTLNSNTKVNTQIISNTTINTTTKDEPLSDDKLINLKIAVQKLAKVLLADSNEADIQEQNLQKSFETLIKEFNVIISELEQNIDRIKNQIKEMEKCIADELVIMNSASNKNNRNDRLLKLAEITCTDFLKSFVDATRNRARQIEVVKDIIQIIKRRYGQLPSKFLEEVNIANNHFKTYINTTQFQKYVEITRIKISDNLRGRKLSNN